MPDAVTTARDTPFPALSRTALFWGGYATILVAAAMAKGMASARWGQLVWGGTSAVAILVLTLIFLNREGRAVGDVGLRVSAGSALRFLAGALIGAGNYALIIIAASAVSGPIRFAQATAPGGGTILLTACTVLALATMEELGFRGYPLRTLAPAVGAWRAQAVVAVAFGLCHVAFGWSWQAVLFGVVPSGLLFGAAALASGGLAMPIGLHAAMNLARWAAGETDAPGIWTMAVDESARGPLARSAPIVGLIVTLLSTAALWGWHLSRSRGAHDEA